MRLSDFQIQTIKQTIYAVDADTKIYLFGSRTNDDAKGGDIDLLVLSKKIGLKEQLNIKLRLYDQLGEQKIDLLVTEQAHTTFQKMVMNEGILL
ncbi:MAG: nucleotidyltransferase domain-containing protein [SAR324 cluster bacterium]|nr:nucleotidyltransferase domain-containing protein [SAR324 cluster bacterium]MBF0351792.1 nucleotidyltransferase domain-containing protein [SAR324 cluster bacterium]